MTGILTPEDRDAIRNRAALVYVTAHGVDGACPGCPTCILASQDVPLLLAALTQATAELEGRTAP